MNPADGAIVASCKPRRVSISGACLCLDTQGPPSLVECLDTKSALPGLCPDPLGSPAGALSRAGTGKKILEGEDGGEATARCGDPSGQGCPAPVPAVGAVEAQLDACVRAALSMAIDRVVGGIAADGADQGNFSELSIDLGGVDLEVSNVGGEAARPAQSEPVSQAAPGSGMVEGVGGAEIDRGSPGEVEGVVGDVDEAPDQSPSGGDSALAVGPQNPPRPTTRGGSFLQRLAKSLSSPLLFGHPRVPHTNEQGGQPADHPADIGAPGRADGGSGTARDGEVASRMGRIKRALRPATDGGAKGGREPGRGWRRRSSRSSGPPSQGDDEGEPEARRRGVLHALTLGTRKRRSSAGSASAGGAAVAPQPGAPLHHPDVARSDESPPTAPGMSPMSLISEGTPLCTPGHMSLLDSLAPCEEPPRADWEPPPPGVASPASLDAGPGPDKGGAPIKARKTPSILAACLPFASTRSQPDGATTEEWRYIPKEDPTIGRGKREYAEFTRALQRALATGRFDETRSSPPSARCSQSTHARADAEADAPVPPSTGEETTALYRIARKKSAMMNMAIRALKVPRGHEEVIRRVLQDPQRHAPPSLFFY